MLKSDFCKPLDLSTLTSRKLVLDLKQHILPLETGYKPTRFGSKMGYSTCVPSLRRQGCVRVHDHTLKTVSWPVAWCLVKYILLSLGNPFLSSLH